MAADVSKYFLGFHGGQFNVSKSSVVLLRWKQTTNDGESLAWVELDWEVIVHGAMAAGEHGRMRTTMRRLDGSSPGRYHGADTIRTVWCG